MLSFKNWPIGRKLKFMNYVLLANMLFVGGVGYWEAEKLRGFIDQATHRSLPAVRSTTLINMIHDGVHGIVFQAGYAHTMKHPEMMKTVIQDMAEYTEQAHQHFEDLFAIPLVTKTKEMALNSQTTVNKYLGQADEIIKLYVAGKSVDAEAKLPEFENTFHELETSLDAQSDQIMTVAKKITEDSNAFSKLSQLVGFLIIGLGLLVGILLPLMIFRSLLSTMNSAIGSLTAEASQVRNSASDIRISSENLSSATTEQASALQETASSIEEMNAMVKKSSDNATRSQDVSKQSHSAASKGKDAVNNMMKAIEEINASNDTIMRQTEESNRKISDIVKVIQEIGNKTKVINDIVFQTKLLSFNASVEAARAGEHGKGFAVVAEEVGNLAAMSGNAAKEISEMLDGSIKQVESIIGETKRSIERLIAEGKSKVEAGTEVAKQCSNILDEVVNNVTHVDSMIQEIATASREQAQGIGEITRAMNQLDQVTHQNSSTSTQVASSSEQLARQSEALMSVVTSLKEFVHGSTSSDQMSESTISAPAKMAMHPKAAEKLVELSEATEIQEAPEAAKPEVKVEAVTQVPAKPSRPVPGVSLSRVKMMSSGGALDSIPSEDDARFKDL